MQQMNSKPIVADSFNRRIPDALLREEPDEEDDEEEDDDKDDDDTQDEGYSE